MSEIAEPQTKPKSARSSSADGRVLAQVEKWMETIREFNRDVEPEHTKTSQLIDLDAG